MPQPAIRRRTTTVRPARTAVRPIRTPLSTRTPAHSPALYAADSTTITDARESTCQSHPDTAIGQESLAWSPKPRCGHLGVGELQNVGPLRSVLDLPIRRAQRRPRELALELCALLRRDDPLVAQRARPLAIDPRISAGPQRQQPGTDPLSCTLADLDEERVELCGRRSIPVEHDPDTLVVEPDRSAVTTRRSSFDLSPVSGEQKSGVRPRSAP